MTGDGFAEPFPVRLARRLESASSVDRLDPPVKRLADALLASPARAELLQGQWLGHALHPLLTDLPLGSWTSMSILDLWGGPESQQAAERLLLIGLASAAPTALTGLAEWGQTSGGERRVGFLHGAGNVLAVGLYASSYVARRQGRQTAGVRLGLAGAAVAAAAGYLGSHLSLARKVGTRHPVFQITYPGASAERVAGRFRKSTRRRRSLRTRTLEYRVPDPQDPVDLLAALARAGYGVREVGRRGVRYVSIVLPDERRPDHRERARAVIAEVSEVSLDGKPRARGRIRFEDEN